MRRLAKLKDEIDIDFQTCETLQPDRYALPENKTGFRSVDEWERAKALFIDIGNKIDRRRPMGYGDFGMLVVFPTNVPNNTLPALRSYGRSGSSPWNPLFERITH